MSMDGQALKRLLDSLIERWESEVVEFKRGGKGFSTSDLGKYLSALANEANLRAYEGAWLVFGIDDKTRRIVGSEYRQASGELDRLKMQVADGTEPARYAMPAAAVSQDGGWWGLLQKGLQKGMMVLQKEIERSFA